MSFSKFLRPYAPLPQEDGVEEKLLQSPVERESSEQPRQRPPSSALTSWTLFGCILCTLVNVILFAFFTPRGPEPLHRSSPLPRPNQYVGLDKVNRNISGIVPPKPINTYPPVLTQVSKKHKDYVFPIDPKRFFTLFGTVSPDDRRFYVNDTVNTIAQFRVQDFGMELCHIVVNVPTVTELQSIHKPKVATKTFTLSSPKVSVNVYKLQYDDPHRLVLDQTKLSWNTKPKRAGDGSPIATLEVSEGNWVQSGQFRCPSDSLPTFEFECVGEGCVVDWWQDKVPPLLAMFLHQHPSV